MYYANPRAQHVAYPARLQAIMSISEAQRSHVLLSSWQHLSANPTPLYALPGLAAAIGVGSIDLKDESVRSPLASFKALGAPVALVRLILRTWPDHGIDAAALLRGEHRGLLEDFTVISATDGNHGRALAAAAQSVGCRCVIVIHANVSVERADAIAAYGAEIVRISGNYDESVVHAADLAAANGWHVVSDTSYPGYTDIPRDVMQGYSIIAAEIMAQSQATPTSSPYTHVFLQGGVGGFAAGVASYLWEIFGTHRPRIVVVEPAEADCLYQSAILGRPATATGSVDSVMAGLACGETSPLAWQFLDQSVDDFVLVPDDAAVATMRIVAIPPHGDIPIVGGESGIAGLAGLIALCTDAGRRTQCALDAHSRILVINTEGATAPSVYHDLTGVTATSVVAQQRIWNEQHHDTHGAH
jgi:diaminopropionate ammonia-lyase